MDINMFLDDEMDKDYFTWINDDEKEFLEHMLHKLVGTDNASIDVLEQVGSDVYKKEISFSKLAIFLDIFSYKLSLEEKEQLRKNENKLAYGYLQQRLPKEIKTLKLGISNNANFVGKSDLAIVDELLIWLESLVESLFNDTEPPRIEHRINEFIDFVEQRAGLFFDDEDVKEDFLKTNKELYFCAIEAVNFFERKQYFHFCIIYIEMIALFLKMVTLLSGMFVEEELLSIYIDPITLLPNRFQLLKDIQLIQNVYVLIFNIKSFSRFNVSYGYDLGDTILKKVAKFLMTTDVIKSYRIYGDEFAILVENPQQAEEIYKKLNKSINIIIEGEKYDILFYGAYDRFVPNSLESCEFALFKGEKKDITNSADIQELIENVKNEISLTQKLKEIMLKDSIVPYYQPIYVTDKKVEKVLKYEVLMRLRYDDTILEPADFMQTLLKAPFYVEFTKSMLIKSFEMFENSSMTFSVNFTLQDVKDKGVNILLETLCAKYPEVASRLTIEIIENEALQDFDKLNQFFKRYRKYDIKYALDDFGSGYANFAQFAKLDIDFLKIDGSIISNLIESDRMHKLLDSVLEFAKTFYLVSVAEYVSSEELFELLKDKVDMIQGYYIGKPEPYLLSDDKK